MKPFQTVMLEIRFRIDRDHAHHLDRLARSNGIDRDSMARRIIIAALVEDNLNPEVLDEKEEAEETSKPLEQG